MDKLYLHDVQKKKRDTHHGLIFQMVRNPLLLKNPSLPLLMQPQVLPQLPPVSP